MPEPNENPNPEGNENTAPTAEDVARLTEALRKERDARSGAEKQAKDLASKLASIESSGKSESEKLAARLEALEKDNAVKSRAIQERDAKDAAIALAGGSKNDSAGVVWMAIKSDVEYDDAGQPTNLRTLIDTMKRDAPQLFRPVTGKGDGGAGNTSKPDSSTNMNNWIRQTAGVET